MRRAKHTDQSAEQKIKVPSAKTKMAMGHPVQNGPNVQNAQV